MSGKVVHFEIPYDDAERAGEFYSGAFGWQLVTLPDQGYTLASTGPSDLQTGPTEPGFINGGLFQRNEEFPGKNPNIVIDVPDVDDALRKVEESGGKVVRGRTPVGEMGFAAYFTDTEGNFVGLWETA